MSIADFERRKLIQQNAEKLAEDMVAELRCEMERLRAALIEISQFECQENWHGAVSHLQSLADEALKGTKPQQSLGATYYDLDV